MSRRIYTAICLVLCIFVLAGTVSGCSGSFLPLSHNSTSYDKSKIRKELVDGNTRFAFNIFRQLVKEDAKQNIFISPLSISTALSMTYQGAQASTKTAMTKALEYTGTNDEALNESYKNLLRYLSRADSNVELNISNSLWILKGENIKEGFITVNKDIFSAAVTSLDFSKADAAAAINKWISDATKKKIDKMIDSPISSDIVMYLINAIYFKGDWTVKFDVKNTASAPFHADDGSTGNVMMMSRNGDMDYRQGDNYKVVRLPYGKGKMSMYCILPAENIPVDTFISSLDSVKWKAIKESISESEKVQLNLPRFKLEYGIKNLNDSLTALGMGEAFSDKADFSGIREGLFISRVLHKAVIEVNEEGSKAAAATAVEMTQAAVANPLIFNADRPFVFIISDDETGTILFMGKMTKAA